MDAAQPRYNDATDSKPQIPWLALQTRSRHEKVLARELEKKGIDYFLPLRDIPRRWSDRKMVISTPLFPGYLFVNVSLEDRLIPLTTVGAVRYVGAQQPWEVPLREIWALKKFVEQSIQVDPYPYLHCGDRVRVIYGPLKGVEGFIVRKQSKYRLVISIEIMMQSAAVEIDIDAVEAIR